MKRLVEVFSKVMGACHVLLGAGLVWLGFRILEPAFRNTPGLDLRFVTPPLLIAGALAGWLVLLGVRSWRRAPGWIAELSWTHIVTLLVAFLQIGFGWLAIRGAERSAAHGGGLLGGLGYLQVGAGLALAAFALVSLTLAALAAASERPR